MRALINKAPIVGIWFKKYWEGTEKWRRSKMAILKQNKRTWVGNGVGVEDGGGGQNKMENTHLQAFNL